MPIPLHLIWTSGPEIFASGIFQFRWYTLLLVAAVLAARWIFLRYMSRTAVSSDAAKTWFNRSVVGMLVAARVIHVVCFQPYLIKARPWQILLPFDFSDGFRFTGTQGFSAMGAAAGLLLMIWLASRKLKVSFGTVAAPALTVFLLVMAVVRVGDFMNSDQFGIPTDSKAGVIFTNPEQRGLMKVPCCVMRTPDGENPLTQVKATKGVTLIHHETGFKPVILYLWFKQGSAEQLVREFLIGDVKAYLFDHKDHFYEPGDDALHYTIFYEEDNTYIARVQTVGVARHPFQLYEAVVFFVLFLFFNRYLRKADEMSARVAGVLLSLPFGLHFLLDFVRDAKQLAWVPLHTEQVLSIALVVAGLMVLLTSRRKATA